MLPRDGSLADQLTLTVSRVRDTISRREHGGWFRPAELNLLQVVGGVFELEHPEVGRRSLRAGQAVIVKPAERYYICIRSPAAAKVRYSHLEISFFGTMRLSEIAGLPVVLPPRYGRPLGDAMARLEQARQARDLDDLPSLGAERRASAELLYQIVRHARIHEQGRQMLRGARRLLPVIVYMREHLDHPVGRADLASVARLSPSRFSAAFADALGTSPMRFLLRLRLQAARSELLHAGTTATQVAERYCFADVFHFSKSFKRYFGVSPRAYVRSLVEQGPR